MAILNSLLAQFGAPTLLKRVAFPAEGQRRDPFLGFGGVKIIFPRRRSSLPVASLALDIYGDKLQLLSNGQPLASLQVDSNRTILRDGKAVGRFFNGAEMRVKAEDLFPDVFSSRRVKFLHNAKHNYGHFTYGSVRFTISLEGKEELAAELKSGEFVYEIQPGSLAFFRREQKIGGVAIGPDGYILVAGKPFERDGRPINLHQGARTSVNLAEFVPALAEHERPLCISQGEQGPKARAIYEKIHFRFPVDQRCPYRDDILAGRVKMRVKDKNLIEIVLTEAEEVTVLDEIRFAEDGRLLQRLESREFVPYRREVRQGLPGAVGVAEICPGLAVLEGPVVYKPTVKLATVELDGIEYAFPRQENAVLRDLIAQRRLFYRRLSSRAVVIILVNEDRFDIIGHIRFDAEGRLLKPDGTIYLKDGQEIRRFARIGRRVPYINIVDLIPTAGETVKTMRQTSISNFRPIRVQGRDFYLPADPNTVFGARIGKGLISLKYDRQKVFLVDEGAAGFNLLRLEFDRAGNLCDGEGRRIAAGRTVSLGEQFPWLKTNYDAMAKFYKQPVRSLREWASSVGLDELLFKTLYYLSQPRRHKMPDSKAILLIRLAAARVEQSQKLPLQEKLSLAILIETLTNNYSSQISAKFEEVVPLTYAQWQMVIDNRSLITPSARKAFRLAKLNGYTLDEITSAGEDGLIFAVRNFDASKGEIEMYARRCIRGFILHFLSKRKPALSLDTTRRTDTSPLMDSLAEPGVDPEMAAGREDQNQRVRVAINEALDEREKEIVERHHGLNGYAAEETLVQIGQRKDLSGERIRQIEAKAHRKLKKALANI